MYGNCTKRPLARGSIGCDGPHDNGVWGCSQGRGEGFVCPPCWNQFRRLTTGETHRNRVRAFIILSILVSPLVIWGFVAFPKRCWTHSSECVSKRCHEDRRAWRG